MSSSQTDKSGRRLARVCDDCNKHHSSFSCNYPRLLCYDCAGAPPRAPPSPPKPSQGRSKKSKKEIDQPMVDHQFGSVEVSSHQLAPPPRPRVALHVDGEDSDTEFVHEEPPCHIVEHTPGTGQLVLFYQYPCGCIRPVEHSNPRTAVARPGFVDGVGAPTK